MIYESIKAHLLENSHSLEDRVYSDFLKFMLAGACSKTFATCIAYPHGKYHDITQKSFVTCCSSLLSYDKALLSSKRNLFHIKRTVQKNLFLVDIKGSFLVNIYASWILFLWQISYKSIALYTFSICLIAHDIITLLNKM